ncbi:MAG: hypothetical protein IT462_06825 [Planctomycetes bacterium]|nr:hypothetical protein [Planctomycetota bacterium]
MTMHQPKRTLLLLASIAMLLAASCNWGTGGPVSGGSSAFMHSKDRKSQLYLVGLWDGNRLLTLVGVDFTAMNDDGWSSFKGKGKGHEYEVSDVNSGGKSIHKVTLGFVRGNETITHELTVTCDQDSVQINDLLPKLAFGRAIQVFVSAKGFSVANSTELPSNIARATSDFGKPAWRSSFPRYKDFD